jgi:Protein of unknown function (DUF1326)
MSHRILRTVRLAFVAWRSQRLALFSPFPFKQTALWFDGNATARLYVDDAANADQRRELEAICSGQKGGPMATLAPLIAKWLPARSAKIDFADNGDGITLTVGDAGRVESRRLRDPQGQGFTLRGGGFVSGLGMEEVDLAPSGSRWTDPDLRQFTTKSGARGEFSWSG